MRARSALLIGTVFSLAWGGAGPCHALSLRSSAAVLSSGDASPGTTLALSDTSGSRLRVENLGEEAVRVEFRAISPPHEQVRDGYDPWPEPEKVRLSPSRAELAPGKAVELKISVPVPKSLAPGGQYEVDVLAVGHERSGASLTLKTRALLSLGAPLATADPPKEGWSSRPGFRLAPSALELEKVPLGGDGRGPGEQATFKIVNAGDEDLTVSLSPARDWDEEARVNGGDEPAANPRWLRLDPGIVQARAGTIVSARVGVSLPKQERYAGRKMVFVVAVDAQAGGRRTRRWFALHVKTSDWEEEKRGP